jgi:hypothetical protein
MRPRGAGFAVFCVLVIIDPRSAAFKCLLKCIIRQKRRDKQLDDRKHVVVSCAIDDSLASVLPDGYGFTGLRNSLLSFSNPGVLINHSAELVGIIKVF